MKQRNAMIAVWTALLIAIIAVLATASGSRETRAELKPGERRAVIVSPGATEVRLFVEGLPFREPPRIQKIMNDGVGILLTKDQRAVLDRAVHRYRLKPGELGEARPACFIPHHFFRYYDNSGKQIGELAVCYCCGGIAINSDFADPYWGQGVLQFDYGSVAKMLKEIEIPTNIECQNPRY